MSPLSVTEGPRGLTFCPQAADGGRLDQDGEPCVPPLGNGAKAAFESSSGSAPAATYGEKQAAATPSNTGAPNGVGFSNEDQKTPQAEELHSNMQNLSVGTRSGFTGESSAISTTDDRRSTDTFESAKETLSVDEAPVVKTAEGPPAGAVVFDHPPTVQEQKCAEKLLNEVDPTNATA